MSDDLYRAERFIDTDGYASTRLVPETETVLGELAEFKPSKFDRALDALQTAAIIAIPIVLAIR